MLYEMTLESLKIVLHINIALSVKIRTGIENLKFKYQQFLWCEIVFVIAFSLAIVTLNSEPTNERRR